MVRHIKEGRIQHQRNNVYIGSYRNTSSPESKVKYEPQPRSITINGYNSYRAM